MQMTSDKQGDRIAISYAAIGVTEQRPVGIAIKSDAQIESTHFLSHCCRDSFRMESATILVNVLAIRRRTEKCRLDTAGPKQLWRLRGGRAIRAVHQQPHPSHVGTNLRAQPMNIVTAKLRFAGQAGCEAGGWLGERLWIFQQREYLL